MNITCWNCKKTYSIGDEAVNNALSAMTASGLDFYDVPCPSCGKENRTKRADFEAAKQAGGPQLRGVEARKARDKEKRDLQKKKGYKGK